ncbi:hypothetical protein DFH29DRAFT_904299 [Suillus ampliporus]|nr:hypothetical protein DFH29DRAFT_904299 [Suillus ampliporus]
MDPSDFFLSIDFLEATAYNTSVSAPQRADPLTQLTIFSGDTNTENRNRIVTDIGSVRPTPLLHVPQSRGPLIYQPASESMYMGLSIPRPPAPSPILAMQDNLLGNFCNIFHNPPPDLPPCNRSRFRFKPYNIYRPHKHLSTFLCRWDNEGTICGHELLATSKDIFAHLRENHHIGVHNKEPCHCLWVAPHGRCDKQLMIQSFGRHIITHLGIRIKCSVCGTVMARDDLAARHRQEHPQCSKADSITILGYDTQALF